jgi:hypothetical protein
MARIDFRVAPYGKISKEIRSRINTRMSNMDVIMYDMLKNVVSRTRDTSMVATGECIKTLQGPISRPRVSGNGFRGYDYQIVWDWTVDGRLAMMENPAFEGSFKVHTSRIQHYRRKKDGKVTNKPYCSKNTFSGKYGQNPQARQGALRKSFAEIMGIYPDMSELNPKAPGQVHNINFKNVTVLENIIQRKIK